MPIFSNLLNKCENKIPANVFVLRALVSCNIIRVRGRWYKERTLHFSWNSARLENPKEINILNIHGLHLRIFLRLYLSQVIRRLCFSFPWVNECPFNSSAKDLNRFLFAPDKTTMSPGYNFTRWCFCKDVIRATRVTSRITWNYYLEFLPRRGLTHYQQQVNGLGLLIREACG